MSRAILEIDGDASGLRLAFTSAREESARTTVAILEDAQRMSRAQRAMWRAVQRQALEALAAIREEDERATTTATERAERRKRIADDETGARTQGARTTTTALNDSEEAITRNQERASRRRRRVLDEEAREAIRVAERVRRANEATGREVAGRTLQVATQAGGQVLGEARTERERFAQTERLTGAALYQAGASRGEVQLLTRSVQHFAADHGLDEVQVAQALNDSQTEFSTLGDRTSTRRSRNLNFNRFLDKLLLARNTGNNLPEFGRLVGLFGQTGFDDRTQHAILLEIAGLAQRGSIEVGSVTREAMPAITARIGQAVGALGPNATGAQREAAARVAFRQAMAEVEVARGTQGTSAREAGNVMRNVNVALGSDVVQGKMLTNIRARLGRDSELEHALFEADPTRRGHLRLRHENTDALTMVETFGRVAGNDSQLFQNIFAGGGHGNPLSLLANQRRLLGNMLNVDTSGKTGVQRVRDLLQGSALTAADVTRGEEVFGTDTTAELARDRARRGLALTAPSMRSAVAGLDRFAAEHPMLAPLASAATSVLGERFVQRAGGALGGMLGGVRNAPGGLLGRVAGPVAAFFGTLLTPGNAGQGAWNDRDMIRAHADAGGGRVGTEAALQAMEQAVARGVERGLHGANVNATVSAHDAARLDTTGASSRGRR